MHILHCCIAIFGGQKEIEVPCSERCDKCDGTNAKSSSFIKSCTECGGRGGVMKFERTPFGIMSQVKWTIRTKQLMVMT